MPSRRAAPAVAVFCLATLAAGDAVRAQPPEELPVYLRDRGTGIPVSMFGTYVRRGELLIYPFAEYYYDRDYEYKPQEFGYGVDEDFRGDYRAVEGLIFLGYGITDWLAVEVEAAVIDARLVKSPDDSSATPHRIEESGVGDIEGQLRARWMQETAGRPEGFAYFEAVAPNQRDKLLIGTPDWEFKLGVGFIKGYGWGTLTFRTAIEYSLEESKGELGEYAVEYLKRFSPAWRIYLGIEGAQDEVECIPELQWHLSDTVFLKLNSAFGITSKATDWAPEVGVMFHFPLAGG